MLCSLQFPVLLAAINNTSPFYFAPLWPKSYHGTGPQSIFMRHLVRHRTLSKTLCGTLDITSTVTTLGKSFTKHKNKRGASTVPYRTLDITSTGLLFLILFVIIIIITSTSDLQQSIPTTNQLPGQLVSTEIITMYKNKF